MIQIIFLISLSTFFAKQTLCKCLWRLSHLSEINWNMCIPASNQPLLHLYMVVYIIIPSPFDVISLIAHPELIIVLLTNLLERQAIHRKVGEKR